MRNPFLCIGIVGVLGVCVWIGLFGIVILSYLGREPSQALVAIVSSAVGALSSFLVSPPRGSFGVGGPHVPPSPPSPA